MEPDAAEERFLAFAEDYDDTSEEWPNTGRRLFNTRTRDMRMRLPVLRCYHPNGR